MRTSYLLLAATVAASATSLEAQGPSPATRPRTGTQFPITASEIEAHIRFLSSDLLEGRAPGTRGGRLAAEYIATQLRASGVQPGAGSWYFQPVPVDIIASDRPAISAIASGRATARLRDPEDVVLSPGSATATSEAHGELVFVGYGAAAPEFRWEDFKGEDLKGKVLLVLVNDPPAPASEPELFGGKAMTYYGRWTYKYEEGERRGASAVLIVHTTAAAAYPWHTVVGSWGKEQRMLPRPATAPAPLGVRGWIQDSVARALLAQAGLDLVELRRRAESRDFRPVHTGIQMDLSLRNRIERTNMVNVVGVVRGTDPRLREQYVVYSAHFDHLGMGPIVAGDSIYNGAEDNASGVAAVLAIARSAAARPKTRRSQLFVFVDGEESGLLGSEYFGAHPTVPIGRIIANLNVDIAKPYGLMESLEIRGSPKSTLNAWLESYIRPMGMRLEPDPNPERGRFYRSDHFSFAKVGVPGVSIGAGMQWVGHARQWGVDREEDYNAHRYHQPSDEFNPAWDFRGPVQMAEVVAGFGAWIANASQVPTWLAGSEFAALRPPLAR